MVGQNQNYITYKKRRMIKILVQNLVKKFGNKVALKGINFEVEKGEIFAYIGPNGAGKTTTIRILLQIIKPTSGVAKILYDNEILSKEKIGFVLENEVPFEKYTPFEYLKFYGEIYKVRDIEKKIQILLEKLNLKKREKDKIATFSKGMKRKLCIAKALISDPEVIILDEPLEGIEIEARKEIRDILLEIKKDKIIFLSSHNLYEIETICTSVGIINEGKFIGKWQFEEIKGKSLEEFYFEKIKNVRNENTP